MWEISKVKEKGRTAMKGNYWFCVLASFIMSLFGGVCSASVSTQSPDPNLASDLETMPPEEAATLATAILISLLGVLAFSLIIKVFLANPIEVGGCTFFKENVKSTPAPFALMKSGFQHYWHTFKTIFLKNLFLCLWSLLLIVPGIIKSYSYRMVPYILAENPDMPASDIITKSREMMNGHKWRTFLLDLSFIGWVIVGVLTLGLGLAFWTVPYMHSTEAALYEELKNSQAAA